MIDLFALAQLSGARLIIVVAALSGVGAAFLPASIVGGFSCGALAFCFAVVSLEQISRRALQLGDVRRGVHSGFLWVLLKFFGPAGTIFYGIWRGFSPMALTAGIFISLAVFAFIIWLSNDRIRPT